MFRVRFYMMSPSEACAPITTTLVEAPAID